MYRICLEIKLADSRQRRDGMSDCSIITTGASQYFQLLAVVCGVECGLDKPKFAYASDHVGY